MRLDLPGREPFRVQRDHVARQAVETPPMLGHRHGLERPGPVTRNRQVDLADLSRHPLGRRPVSGVPRPAALDRVTLTAQMLGHLDLQAGLEHLAHQPGQQTALAGQLHALSASLSDQPLSPLNHRRLTGSVARQHSRHVKISRRHDPPRPPAARCGPSDHIRIHRISECHCSGCRGSLPRGYGPVPCSAVAPQAFWPGAC